MISFTVASCPPRRSKTISMNSWKVTHTGSPSSMKRSSAKSTVVAIHSNSTRQTIDGKASLGPLWESAGIARSDEPKYLSINRGLVGAFRKDFKGFESRQNARNHIPDRLTEIPMTSGRSISRRIFCRIALLRFENAIRIAWIMVFSELL